MGSMTYTLEAILDNALDGCELNNEPVNFSEKEKEKQRKWEKKQKEKQEQESKKYQVQIAAIKQIREKVKEQADAEYKDESKYVRKKYEYETIVDDLINCRDRDKRSDLEEALIQAIDEFSKTDLTDPSNCILSEYLTIHPERFIRNFNDRKRYLICYGKPIRPAFFIQDKTSKEKIFYPVWTDIHPDTLSIEFGSKIPSRRLRSGEYEPIGTEPQNYFAVQHWDPESKSFRNVMLRYEKIADEFSHINYVFDEFFKKIVSESKRQFDILKANLEKYIPGMFRTNHVPDDIKSTLHTFLKEGGKPTAIRNIIVSPTDVVVFKPTHKYVLVDIAHHKSVIIDPVKAFEEGATGISKLEDGNIAIHIPRHMALIQVLGPKMTVIRSA